MQYGLIIPPISITLELERVPDMNCHSLKLPRKLQWKHNARSQFCSKLDSQIENLTDLSLENICNSIHGVIKKRKNQTKLV